MPTQWLKLKPHPFLIFLMQSIAVSCLFFLQCILSLPTSRPFSCTISCPCLPHSWLAIPSFEPLSTLYHPWPWAVIAVYSPANSEKAMATHSSTLTWKIPWMEEPGRLQSMGSLRAGHDWATSVHFSLSCIGEGNGNPLQCSCLENPRDGGAWWAAVSGVAQSLTRLKWLSSSSSSTCQLSNELRAWYIE